jgi:hypothetical protein
VLLFLAAISLCAGMLAQASPDASSHALFLQRLVNAAIERTHHFAMTLPMCVFRTPAETFRRTQASAPTK